MGTGDHLDSMHIAKFILMSFALYGLPKSPTDYCNCPQDYGSLLAGQKGLSSNSVADELKGWNALLLPIRPSSKAS
ncbi:MAG: hypothetical protein AAF732_09945 [Pseudomonadota bacterium]